MKEAEKNEAASVVFRGPSLSGGGMKHERTKLSFSQALRSRLFDDPERRQSAMTTPKRLSDCSSLAYL